METMMSKFKLIQFLHPESDQVIDEAVFLGTTFEAHYKAISFRSSSSPELPGNSGVRIAPVSESDAKSIVNSGARDWTCYEFQSHYQYDKPATSGAVRQFVYHR